MTTLEKAGSRHAASHRPAAKPLGIGEIEPELDQPVRIVGARLWAGFLALALFVGVAVVWGTFGSLPRHLSLTGVVIQAPGDKVATVQLFVTSATDVGRLHTGDEVVLSLGGIPVSGHLAAIDPFPSTGSQLTGKLSTPLPGVPEDGSPVWTAQVAVNGPLTAPSLVPVQATVVLPSLRPYQVLFGVQS
jgi:hypothetical protein